MHCASTSVTIDSEIAEIAGQLELDIALLVEDEDAHQVLAEDFPNKNNLPNAVVGDVSGYITHVDVKN